ncbi:DUF2079 domain-containing protein [Fibrobacterota bacterium]
MANPFLISLFPAGFLLIVKNLFDIQWIYFPLLLSVAFFGAVCLQGAWEKSKGHVLFLPLEKRAHGIAAVFSLMFFISFSVLSISRFNAFSTEMIDFGNMDQAVWNTSQGRLLELTSTYYPYENSSRLGFHTEFIYLPFALAYKVFPEPRLLFIFQSLFLAASVFLVFLLSREIVKNDKLALAVCLVYGLFPALHFMALFDVHGDVFSVPFLFLAYLLYVKQRPLGHWICLVLALLCKEYVSLAVMGYGLGLAFFHRDKKNGLAVAGLALAYFFTMMYGIIPVFNEGRESMLISDNFEKIGGQGGLGGMLMYMVMHPAGFFTSMLSGSNFENLFYLFFPLFFICWYSPVMLLGAIPILLKDMLAGLDIFTHRLAPALPYLAIAFIYGLKKMSQSGGSSPGQYRRALRWAPVAAVLVGTYAYGPSPLGHRFWREKSKYTVSHHDKVLKRFVEKIPETGRVSVSGHIAPYLTHRQYCYVFPRPFDLSRIDFILLDTLNRKNHSWDSTDSVRAWIPRVSEFDFILADSLEGILLYTKEGG